MVRPSLSLDLKCAKHFILIRDTQVKANIYIRFCTYTVLFFPSNNKDSQLLVKIQRGGSRQQRQVCKNVVMYKQFNTPGTQNEHVKVEGKQMLILPPPGISGLLPYLMNPRLCAYYGITLPTELHTSLASGVFFETIITSARHQRPLLLRFPE